MTVEQFKAAKQKFHVDNTLKVERIKEHMKNIKRKINSRRATIYAKPQNKKSLITKLSDENDIAKKELNSLKTKVVELQAALVANKGPFWETLVSTRNLLAHPYFSSNIEKDERTILLQLQNNITNLYKLLNVATNDETFMHKDIEGHESFICFKACSDHDSDEELITKNTTYNFQTIKQNYENDHNTLLRQKFQEYYEKYKCQPTDKVQSVIPEETKLSTKRCLWHSPWNLIVRLSKRLRKKK